MGQKPKTERKNVQNQFIRRNQHLNQTVTQNFLNQSIDSNNYRSNGSSLERNAQAVKGGPASGRNTMLAGADGGIGTTSNDFVTTFFPSVGNSSKQTTRKQTHI